MPIGILTSQLFSNVYMNELDQYVKRTLHCKHYGRYVDDFFIVSADKAWLASLQQPIKTFLQEHLGLELNAGKTRIYDVRYGIDFLGAYLKPHRKYVSNRTLGRMKPKIGKHSSISEPEKIRCTLNSFLGLLSHYKSYHLRQTLFQNHSFVYHYGYYQKGMAKFVLYPFLMAGSDF